MHDIISANPEKFATENSLFYIFWIRYKRNHLILIIPPVVPSEGYLKIQWPIRILTELLALILVIWLFTIDWKSETPNLPSIPSLTSRFLVKCIGNCFIMSNSSITFVLSLTLNTVCNIRSISKWLRLFEVQRTSVGLLMIDEPWLHPSVHYHCSSLGKNERSPLGRARDSSSRFLTFSFLLIP